MGAGTGRPRGVSAFPIFGSTKRSVFLTHTQSRFASVVVAGARGSTSGAPHLTVSLILNSSVSNARGKSRVRDRHEVVGWNRKE